MEQNDQNKRKALQGYCANVACAECKINKYNGCVTLNDMPDNEINNLFEAVFNAHPRRITIRDIIDLLDYDRTGIRTLRIVDDDTKQSDMLKTDSYLMQYIEDTAVNTLDTVNGVITLYVDYGGRKDE